MPKPRMFISHGTREPAEYARRKLPDDAAERDALAARESLARQVGDDPATRLTACGR
jgi:hypothetical protein